MGFRLAARFAAALAAAFMTTACGTAQGTDAHRGASYNPFVALLADFVLLDQDDFSVPVDRTGRREALMTVAAGRIVYSKGFP